MGKALRVSISALAVGLLAAPGFAAVINPFNTRPVLVNPAPGGEADLQDLVDAVLPGAGINVNTDQSSAGMWGMATGGGTTIPTLMFEYTANESTQSFGMWFGTDDTDVLTIELFGGAATGSNNGGATAAGVQFTGNTLDIFALPANCSSGAVNCSTNTNALITSSAFGFYWTRVGGPTYYTVDALNAGGTARALAFSSATNWAIAFEDGTGGPAGLGDQDYNDIVVKVESIAPVPEPGTLLLLGTGISGLALRRRRKVQ